MEYYGTLIKYQADECLSGTTDQVPLTIHVNYEKYITDSRLVLTV